MSLLWSRKLHAVLCPDKLIVVVLSGGFRRKVLSQAIIPLATVIQPDWRLSVQALERWLSENAFGKIEIAVQISSCFSRFAMLPFDEDVCGQAERETVAGMLLEGIYGEVAKQWQFALDEAQYGEPCLVAAIDAALAGALVQLVEPYQCMIVSMKPYAVSVVNAFGKQLQSGSALFAVVEHGQAVLFDIRGEKLHGVRKVLLGGVIEAYEIVGLLRREILVGGFGGEVPKIYLHVAGGKEFKLPASTGLDIVEFHFDDGMKRFGVGFEMIGLGAAK